MCLVLLTFLLNNWCDVCTSYQTATKGRNVSTALLCTMRYMLSSKTKKRRWTHFVACCTNKRWKFEPNLSAPLGNRREMRLHFESECVFFASDRYLPTLAFVVGRCHQTKVQSCNAAIEVAIIHVGFHFHCYRSWVRIVHSTSARLVIPDCVLERNRSINFPACFRIPAGCLWNRHVRR